MSRRNRGLFASITGLILQKAMCNAQDGKKGIVAHSGMFLYAGIVTFIIFGGFAAWAFFEKEVGIALGFCAFQLVSLFLIALGGIWRITYDEEGFKIRSLFGITRRYTYGDITAIKDNGSSYTLYMGKHKVTVELLMSNHIDFYFQAADAYAATHGGEKIPKSTLPPRDLFKGHTDDAGVTFIIPIVLVLALIIPLAIFMGINTFKPTTSDGMTEITVNLERYKYSEVQIYLYDELERMYVFYDDVLTEEDLDLLMSPSTATTILVERVDREDGYYFRARTIATEKGEIFGLADYGRKAKEGVFLAFCLFAGGTLFFIVYFILAVMIGRNPEKYSEKVINLFFRKGYIRY